MQTPLFDEQERGDWAWAAILGVLGATCIYVADVRTSSGIACVFGIYGVIYLTIRLCESPVQRLGDTAFRLLDRWVRPSVHKQQPFYFSYSASSKSPELHPLPPGWVWVRTADGQLVAGAVQQVEKETDSSAVTIR